MATATKQTGENVDKARDEQMALKAWERGGRKGKRPETPNYDAISSNATGIASRRAARAKREGRGERSKRSQRWHDAEAVKKAANGVPAERNRVTDDEVAALIYNVRTANPEAQWRDEMHHARWIGGLSMSQQRWLAAWAAFDPKVKPKPAPKPAAKSTTSKAAAPVKAASRKATPAKTSTKTTGQRQVTPRPKGSTRAPQKRTTAAARATNVTRSAQKRATKRSAA